MDSTQVLKRRLALTLKSLRQQRGYSQVEVSKATGIHIGRLETGSVSCQLSSLERLLAFYLADPAEFLFAITYDPFAEFDVIEAVAKAQDPLNDRMIRALRRVRQDLGIGVDTVRAALKLNVPRIENSKPDVNLITVQRLCAFYDCDLNSLLDQGESSSGPVYIPGLIKRSLRA